MILRDLSSREREEHREEHRRSGRRSVVRARGARVETPRAFESSMMPCLKTFVASIRVSRAREVSRPRPSLGGDPEDRRHQKRNGKRRSPDPELARARGRDRRYRAGTRLADSKRNGKGVERRTGRNESCGGLQDVLTVLGRGNLFGLFSRSTRARLVRCSRRSDWAIPLSVCVWTHSQRREFSLS